MAPPSALFTDLYELTMAQAFQRTQRTGPAVFEIFFRELPERRRYAVAAGVESVLDFLERFRFEAEDLEYLRENDDFSPEFIDSLANMEFTGEVWAMPEGTLVFENEPILQVRAPLVEAQVIETLVLNQIHAQTVLASKAARVVDAAQGRTVVDFGSRRAHGIDAALLVARGSYLAGAAGTSNLLAGRRFGIPTFGTMAHSFVQAFGDEFTAFREFSRLYPQTTLLVDTHDTRAGIANVVRLAEELGEEFRVRAVRLDSGDLGALARDARATLDRAGLTEVKIFASSGLNEDSMDELLSSGAPIDGFGVGTRLAVSQDVAALGLAYKLVEYEGRGRTKLSSNKVILPGPKQVARTYEDGRMTHDVIGRFDEDLPGEPLLEPVMRYGRRIEVPGRDLESARQRCLEQRNALSPHLRELNDRGQPYEVHVSEVLRSDLAAIADHLGHSQ